MGGPFQRGELITTRDHNPLAVKPQIYRLRPGVLEVAAGWDVLPARSRGW